MKNLTSFIALYLFFNLPICAARVAQMGSTLPVLQQEETWCVNATCGEEEQSYNKDIPTANAPVFSISVIPDSIFSLMQGKSYKKGARIMRDDLRYLRISHYDANGRVRVGEMICNKAIANDVISIFQELYKAKYPIERMELIDKYDADDEMSMRANNTSCFNYRVVEGTTSLSAHARGMAIDVNPFYNPYVHTLKGKRVIAPEGSAPYADRSKNFKYKIDTNDLAYKLFIKHGFRWGGSWRSSKDYQHFDKK